VLGRFGEVDAAAGEGSSCAISTSARDIRRILSHWLLLEADELLSPLILGAQRLVLLRLSISSRVRKCAAHVENGFRLHLGGA